jgi:hypothetical protein
LKISPGMAALWRGRFLLQGVEGLLKNSSPRQGARLDSSSDGNIVIKKTTQTDKPAQLCATHSRRVDVMIIVRCMRLLAISLVTSS